MQVLTILTGNSSRAVVDNLRWSAPKGWNVAECQCRVAANAGLECGEIVRADLVLVLAERQEHLAAAVRICELSGAKAAIVPLDRLDRYTTHQIEELRSRFARQGITAIFPQPFCSLTETGYQSGAEPVRYACQTISQFARYFGAPRFDVAAHRDRIVHVGVERAAPCGCSSFVAKGLRGIPVTMAVSEGVDLLRRYRCPALTPQENRRPAPVSLAVKEAMAAAVDDAIQPYKRTRTYKPG